MEFHEIIMSWQQNHSSLSGGKRGESLSKQNFTCARKQFRWRASRFEPGFLLRKRYAPECDVERFALTAECEKSGLYSSPPR